MEKVSVTIKPDGTVVLEGHGFEGKSCVEALEEIARMLGTVTAITHKAEYHRVPRASRRQTQGQGQGE